MRFPWNNCIGCVFFFFFFVNRIFNFTVMSGMYIMKGKDLAFKFSAASPV